MCTRDEDPCQSTSPFLRVCAIPDILFELLCPMRTPKFQFIPIHPLLISRLDLPLHFLTNGIVIMMRILRVVKFPQLVSALRIHPHPPFSLIYSI